jgi:uncharacterized HAD superfamily protein
LSGSTAIHYRIGVDLDGVIYKWTETARWLLNWKFGVEIGDSTHWDYIKEQITEQQWAWLWQNDPDGGIGRGLFRHGHCYKGSFEAMKELDQLGDIVVITHRPKAAIKDTMEWISFNGIPASTVHLMYREEPKSSVKPECGIYVDDKAANCIDLNENTNGLVCLWDRPWNRAEQKNLPSEIQIIDSWEKFLELAKEKAWELHPAS